MADNVGLAPLDATRPHIELYRAWMDERGLAASTVDRRLSTICGYFRFAHIDGRISSNPAQYVRRPHVHPAAQRGMDRGELAAFLFTAERTSPMHAALAALLGLNGLRVSEACGTNVENLGFERGHRTLQIVGKGNKPAGVPLVPRTARTLDLAIGERTAGPILVRHDGCRLDPRTAYRWVRSVGTRAGLDRIHPHMLRAAFIMAALDAGVPLRDVQIAARHADPRTTTIYDRRRLNYDRHAAYAVVAFVTSGRQKTAGPPPPRWAMGTHRHRTPEIARSGCQARADDRSGATGYRESVTAKVVRRWTTEELFRDAGPPTDDDVPIALDGRRLDTPEKVIAYIDEINQKRATSQRDG